MEADQIDPSCSYTEVLNMIPSLQKAYAGDPKKFNSQWKNFCERYEDGKFEHRLRLIKAEAKEESDDELSMSKCKKKPVCRQMNSTKKKGILTVLCYFVLCFGINIFIKVAKVLSGKKKKRATEVIEEKDLIPAKRFALSPTQAVSSSVVARHALPFTPPHLIMEMKDPDGSRKLQVTIWMPSGINQDDPNQDVKISVDEDEVDIHVRMPKGMKSSRKIHGHYLHTSEAMSKDLANKNRWVSNYNGMLAEIQPDRREPIWACAKIKLPEPSCQKNYVDLHHYPIGAATARVWVTQLLILVEQPTSYLKAKQKVEVLSDSEEED